MPIELDVVHLMAETCDAIRRAYQRGSKKQRKAPRSGEVVLLIEAKCYSNTLDLGIGREFLGPYHTEFSGKPVGYLASTAENERIQKMDCYHGKRNQPFWPRMDDLPVGRTAFIQDLARRLGEALGIIPGPVGRRGRTTIPRAGPYQPPLPQFE